MADELQVRARLADNVRFEVEAVTGPAVTLDASDMVVGHTTGMRPMELLLASLAGCLGVTVIGILRKKRQDVTRYELRVRGTEAIAHPRVFETIAVEHLVGGRGIAAEAVAHAIALAEMRYCPVSAMLGRVAVITNTYQIAEVGAR